MNNLRDFEKFILLNENLSDEEIMLLREAGCTKSQYEEWNNMLSIDGLFLDPPLRTNDPNKFVWGVSRERGVNVYLIETYKNNKKVVLRYKDKYESVKNMEEALKIVTRVNVQDRLKKFKNVKERPYWFDRIDKMRKKY